MKYSSQRGTRDILPEDMPVWHAIENTCKTLFELYNYHEIRTPIFEATELFTRSIGQETDIVSKEMYTFTDKGERSLTLRPEATAPVVRAAVQNNLISANRITKLYYVGPMFRYERPQAGRYRQFYQAGVEAFGPKDPALDAEIIILAHEILSHLGIQDLEVDLNSVGCEKCRPAYLENVKSHFSTHLEEMCEDCKNRAEHNPLRIFDCKNPQCKEYIEKAPAVFDSLCSECKDHLEKVISNLDLSNIKYKINKRLVRGLDYYTGTTFEIISKQLGAQNAICGGGRYDDLVSELGGSSVPAVGFAFGIDRLAEILKNASLITHHLPAGRHGASRKLIYIAALGDDAQKAAMDLLQKIRKMGRIAEIDYFSRNLKSQLKEADRLKAKYVIIIGDDELKSGNLILRNMEKATQESIPIPKMLERINLL
ncbi:histidine--tRNA ligase [Candidatus Saganbacteria bacterium]|nr:histidine--tRNA ligase [Candidatus Saganbacteria bacterium]